MSTVSTSRVVLVSAWYDLIVTSAFATPWTARWAADGLRWVHNSADLPGQALVVADPHTMLFINLMGSIVVIWSVVRLRTPTRALGIADTWARVAFSAWMLYALLQGASGVTLVLLVLEIGWAVVQGVAIFRAPGSRPAGSPAPVLGNVT